MISVIPHKNRGGCLHCLISYKTMTIQIIRKDKNKISKETGHLNNNYIRIHSNF